MCQPELQALGQAKVVDTGKVAVMTAPADADQAVADLNAQAFCLAQFAHHLFRTPAPGAAILFARFPRRAVRVGLRRHPLPVDPAQILADFTQQFALFGRGEAVNGQLYPACEFAQVVFEWGSHGVRAGG